MYLDVIDKHGAKFFHPKSNQRSERIANIRHENLDDYDSQMILEYFLFYDYDRYCRVDSFHELCRISMKINAIMSQHVAAYLVDDVYKEMRSAVMDNLTYYNFVNYEKVISEYSKEIPWQKRLSSQHGMFGKDTAGISKTFFEISVNSWLVMPHLVMNSYMSDGNWNEDKYFSLYDEKIRRRSWEAFENLHSEFLLNKHTRDQALLYAADAWSSNHNIFDPHVIEFEQSLFDSPTISISKAHELFELICSK